VIAAALDEAMSLLLAAAGTYALTGRLEIELRGPAPVGAFLELEADVERVEGRRLELAARAFGEGGLVAEARGTYVRREGPWPSPKR
jgi:acyl-coenzyme A thioesterase PaaI-like protein